MSSNGFGSAFKGIQPVWVIDQYFTLQGRVRCKQRHEVDQVAVIGHVSRDIRMRPVSSPENPVGRCGNQRLRERDRVRKRRTIAGDPFRAGDFHPAAGMGARQLRQLLEWRLLEPGLGRHTTHVIDDERHRQAAQELVISNEIDCVKVQIDVPTQGFDACNDAMEFIHVRHAAQVFYEVEAHAAKSCRVQIFEHPFSERIVGVGYASIATLALSDGIDNDGVVDSVTARIDENRSFETQNGLQLLESGERRIRGRVGAIRGVRISVTGTEYVAMRVATARRGTEFRAVSIGVWRFTGGIFAIFAIVTADADADNQGAPRASDNRTDR